MSDEMTDDVAAKARQMDEFLGKARAELGTDVTAQRIHILLNVYLHEGINQSSLLGLLSNTSVTALSRNIADLSALTSSKKAGPGLLELRFDAMNLRRKTIHLTGKGRRAVTRLLKSS